MFALAQSYTNMFRCSFTQLQLDGSILLTEQIRKDDSVKFSPASAENVLCSRNTCRIGLLGKMHFVYILFFMQQDQYNMLEHAMSSMAGGFDPSSNLYCSQASPMGLSGSHGNLQDPLRMKANMLYSNCGGAVPNIILTGKVCSRKLSVLKQFVFSQ